MKPTKTGMLDTPMTRRTFLKTATTTAASAGLATLLSGLPARWAGTVYADDAPELTDMRFGIIALTDCASIVMAHELGLFKKYGINSTVSKEASWAVIRDRLSLGENHGTHMLIGMPYASTMGLFGAPVKPMVIPMHINHNGQAITLQKKFVGKVKSAADMKPFVDEAKAKGEPLTFAMTFPPGTHAMWMRYWLASGGIHPDKDVALITVPPPQMVQNMKIDKMDGFCVGEPWNARAINDGIGYTVITSQQLWADHPEKVLAFTEEFAEQHPKAVKASMRAVIEASRYIDTMDNRAHVAEVVSRPQYINCPPEIILGRMQGLYDYGDGRAPHQDPLYMTFYDRLTNFPFQSYGIWWLTQFRRWGMVAEAPDYQGLAKRVHRTDLFREVAGELGLPVPDADTRTETLTDSVFDPADPEAYATGFAVHNIAAS
jgi:nitrate/nitrite transport system substrate-binding protein